MAARSGELLAKKSQSTVRSNHGVMQNMALLQISAAFPDFPKTQKWRNLAFGWLLFSVSKEQDNGLLKIIEGEASRNRPLNCRVQENCSESAT
ncbi:MAG: hypothetical protein WAW46_08150 [Polaromonas sp.]